MRSRIGITFQAIGVAALGVIVYVAFLSPTDSGPLTGIDIEPPAEQPKNRTAKLDKPPHRPDRPRRRPARAAPAAALPVSTPPQAAANAPPSDSPVGSQYTSTVARILNRIAPDAP